MRHAHNFRLSVCVSLFPAAPNSFGVAPKWSRGVVGSRQKLSPKLTPYFPTLLFVSPTFESSLTFTGRFFFRFERLEYFEEENDLRRSVWRRRTEIQAHSSCAS